MTGAASASLALGGWVLLSGLLLALRVGAAEAQNTSVSHDAWNARIPDAIGFCRSEGGMATDVRSRVDVVQYEIQNDGSIQHVVRIRDVVAVACRVVGAGFVLDILLRGSVGRGGAVRWHDARAFYGFRSPRAASEYRRRLQARHPSAQITQHRNGSPDLMLDIDAEHGAGGAYVVMGSPRDPGVVLSLSFTPPN
jgi:hypothetical protein